jgi:hypothetical protein
MRSLSLTLLAFALAAPSQTPAPHTYRVAGTVVSAIDNHPLQRASIQLLNPENQAPIQTTTSDEYGRFAFTGVPPGNHELQGTAPNYLPTFYDEHEGFNTGIVTGAGVDTESLVLKLHPEAIIAGTVVDESAEPIQNAAVQLFRQSQSFGDGGLVLAANFNTDDLGHFELPRLVAGTYFLAITATPWYAIHPDPTQAANRAAAVQRSGRSDPRRSIPISSFGPLTQQFDDAIDPALDVAYPSTFYPGTTDPTRASPILLHGGESLDLHFQLSPLPAVTLTFPSATQTTGQRPFYPLLTASFRGQGLPVMMDLHQTPTQTVIVGIAPGDYLLTDRATFSQADSGTPIHIGDHSTEAALPPAPDMAHVHVVLQSDAKIPPRTQVVLFRTNREASASQPINEKNEATLDASPGDYSFAVFGEQRSLAVVQVQSGDRRLPSNRIHLNAHDSAFFTVTVTLRTHTLKGIARKDGKPCPGAFILLFPSNEAGDIRTSFRQQSDLDGSFDLPGLAPGTYTLLAIDNAWDLDWQHQGALSRYLPTALTVRISDAADKVQHLPNPVAVQSR